MSSGTIPSFSSKELIFGSGQNSFFGALASAPTPKKDLNHDDLLLPAVAVARV